MQLDETTDIGSDAQLIVFVRYFDTNDFVEQFLFCRPLAKNTTGEVIFKKVDFFFEEHQLEWSNCVSVCADGAPAMMGSNKGFMSFVKRKNNNKTADSDTVSTYQVSSVQLVTDKKLEAFNKA